MLRPRSTDHRRLFLICTFSVKSSSIDTGFVKGIRIKSSKTHNKNSCAHKTGQAPGFVSETRCVTIPEISSIESFRFSGLLPPAQASVSSPLVTRHVTRDREHCKMWPVMPSVTHSDSVNN